MSGHFVGAHGHEDGHAHHHDHDEGAGHGSFRSYLVGFALAVVLTAIPFWLVMDKVFASPGTTAMLLLGLGAVQIIVHMIYFLHMNAKSEGGWNMLALIFTIVLVVITLSGSLWVMYHMNANMMPAMTAPSTTMPAMHGMKM
jgi:cytochrome o ubiquinol oxidase operon protein cyoD